MESKSDQLKFENIKKRLAHAYVPIQQYTRSYSLEEALQKGTLYPELWMPYER